ncbi:hypothetical protein DL764_005437 [Monosporascus ibericus]|uniref:Uncharacterized protein n=1 Tax=Monosporascus ibericus TaxID=155417 RepID=A0A4Q4T921_9PEZI|nr:hypothetical protein DL764_005437 [Monosporascus ibericus]
MGVITDRMDFGLTAFVRKAIDAAIMPTRVGLQYTITGYVDTQCGYGCSYHASATAAGYPSAFVIKAAMSRMSPYVPHGLGRRVYLELLSHAGAREAGRWLRL